MYPRPAETFPPRLRQMCLYEKREKKHMRQKGNYRLVKYINENYAFETSKEDKTSYGDLKQGRTGTLSTV